MIVEHFLKWIDTARVSERAAAANALARAYMQSDLSFEDRCAAEAALTLLLDDPSPRVRAALAEALALSRKAPPQIIHALASDQPEVSTLVLALSPLLDDADLVDRLASGDEAVQTLIASRPVVSAKLAAAIAEIAGVEACKALLENEGARIASVSFRRIADRHGDHAGIRGMLIADRRLPAESRHDLLARAGEALRQSAFLRGAIGAARAERVTRDACARSLPLLIDGTQPEEHAALVEHLRLRGELTTGLAIRLVATGRIDFFGAVMVALSGQDYGRVQALLAGGRDVALMALLRAAGLAQCVHALVRRALIVWREVANGKRIAGAQEVTFLMLRELNPDRPEASKAEREIASLLRSIHLDALRENARGHARAIAAA